MNKNCIFFAISANYAFTAANVIMSLQKHSYELLKSCDIIIYHDGLPPRDKALLWRLHNNIIFEEIMFPDDYQEIIDEAIKRRWGIYILPKLFGFKLVKRYEKVLFLDTDIIVTADISEIFNIEQEIAWRKIEAWNAKENFSCLINNDYISACSGGVVYFTDKINKYNIEDEDILDAYECTKNLKRGGIEERIITLLVYKKKIILKELDITFNYPIGKILPNQNYYKIIHFLDSRDRSTKPWKNLAAYLYFKDWAENYEEWIVMGGEGLVNFTQEDYYELFGFKKADEINRLKAKIKKQNERLKNVQQKYNTIRNSRTWKATKPLRFLLDHIKRFCK